MFFNHLHYTINPIGVQATRVDNLSRKIHNLTYFDLLNVRIEADKERL